MHLKTQEENKVPSKSKKQHNLMAAVANNPAFARKTGIPKSVGEEFMKADKSKKFSGGGLYANIAAKKKRIAAGSGEKMRSQGMAGAPKKGDFANAAKTASYKHGGKTDIKQDKAMAKKAVGMHEKQLHGGKRSNLSTLKKGGGIGVRGKTKSKMC